MRSEGGGGLGGKSRLGEAGNRIQVGDGRGHRFVNSLDVWVANTLKMCGRI